MGLCAVVSGLILNACTKKGLDDVDMSYHHSPEGVNDKLQEQKTVLNQALKKHELVFIHDQAYYVHGLIDALAGKLEGDKKERLDPVLKDLSQLCDEVHDAAGSKNEAATERKLQQLYAKLKQLEPEFKAGKKK